MTELELSITFVERGEEKMILKKRITLKSIGSLGDISIKIVVKALLSSDILDSRLEEEGSDKP